MEEKNIQGEEVQYNRDSEKKGDPGGRTQGPSVAEKPVRK